MESSPPLMTEFSSSAASTMPETNMAQETKTGMEESQALIAGQGDGLALHCFLLKSGITEMNFSLSG